MIHVSFNKKTFFRVLLIFLPLTLGWTALCVATGEFTNTDRGLVSGLGFLLLMPVSIFWGHGPKRATVLVWLILGTIGVFLVGSFVLSAMLLSMKIDSWVVYTVVNSLFVAVAMTMLLDRIYRIGMKYITMAVAFLLMLLAYLVDDKCNPWLQMNFDLNERLTMFNIFQLAMIFPLSFGLATTKTKVR